MADKKKSILEEAIMDAKRIQEALNANSKEILRSVAKEEIDELVKESLKEDYTEEDVEAVEPEEMEAPEGDDMDAEEPEEVEAPEGDDMELDLNAELTGDKEIEDLEIGGDLEGDYESGMDAVASDDEVEMDMTMASDEDVISVYKKLTGDDEIEVVVDDEAGEVKLTVNEPGEFVIKTGESTPEVEDDYSDDIEMDLDAVDAVDGEVDLDVDMDIDDVDDDMDLDAVDAVDGEVDLDAIGDEEDEENVVYEIALDENTLQTGDIDDVTAPVGNKKDDNWAGDNLEGGFEEDQAHGKGEGQMVMNEKEVDEDCNENDLTEEDGVAEGDKVSEKIQVGKKRIVANVQTEIQGAGADANNVKAPNVTAVNESNKKYNTLLTEAKDLKAKNGEYKKALKQFRTMLAETVVFNSNLTYTTKLFMEHSTTRDEKEGIFNRFDNEVSTLKESKKLYKTIASELGSRKPMNESIGNKMNKEVTSSSSKQLNESTAYVDKETSRIMDLMKRVDNK